MVDIYDVTDNTLSVTHSPSGWTSSATNKIYDNPKPVMSKFCYETSENK
jgi:hypothetical protein